MVNAKNVSLGKVKTGKNYSEKSEKTFSIIVLHGILNTEMNDMQNRILCVKCSVNGELSLKRKVRLTVCDPHPLQQYKKISHIVKGISDIRSITIGDILFLFR